MDETTVKLRASLKSSSANRLVVIRACLWLLAALACGISAYLLWGSLSGRNLAGCGSWLGGDCESLLASRWSQWLTLPVSAAAVLVYGGMLAGLALTRPANAAPLQRRGWALLVTLGLIAAGSAIYFLLLQGVLLERICPYCTAVHVAGLLLAALIFWQAPWQFLPAYETSNAAVPSRGLPLYFGLAVVTLAALVVGQVFVAPKLYQVRTVEQLDEEQVAQPEDATAPPAETPAEPKPQRPARWAVLLGGKTGRELGEMPVDGPIDAPHVVVKLFDYTCPHCRHLHFQLQEARQQLGDKVAIALEPMPLSERCNKYVQAVHPRHRHACDYARLAWAVFYADPARFEEFHEYLFKPESPPPVELARGFAEQLLTPEVLTAALADPAVERRLERSVDLYGLTGHDSIPKLVTARYVIDGKFASADQLVEVLNRAFEPAGQ